MLPSFLLKHLTTWVGEIEHEPRLLDRYFAPIFWVGIVFVLLNLAAVAFRSEGCRSRTFALVVKQATLVYAGFSISLTAVFCARVFCAYVDSEVLTPADFERLRNRQLLWLCEVSLVWGIGAVLVGGANLVRTLFHGPKRIRED